MSEYDIMELLDDETLKEIKSIIDEFMQDDEWIATDAAGVAHILLGGEDEPTE